MIDKLKEEELLETLNFFFSRWGHLNEKEQQAHQQIKELIKKPKVTEEWKEEKTEKLILIIQRMITRDVYNPDENRKEIKDFIHSFVEQILDE